MSNKEQAIQIINSLPENKLIFVVDMLNSIRKLIADEETEPDEWDLQMIADAKRENDSEKISFDELLKREGLTYADLQN